MDRARCAVCGACSAVCPRHALIVMGDALVVFPGRCRPCGQAALVCPTGALVCPDADGGFPPDGIPGEEHDG
ncbi:MAG: 4Fe-4S ferredoxin [Candidatus Krumholzibacteriota bacterium]|nr:4Fe-4S ferredoxin [Candidatus Krumholzibacteriota bacterium]